MLRKITLPCLFILISVQVVAQTFTDNREKFVKDLTKYLTVIDPQTTRDFMKDFEPFVLTGQLSDKHFSKMVTTCNLMETKHFKPFPEFYNYVFSVYSFDKNKQPEASYDAWHATLDDLLDSKNSNNFKDFITASSGLFSTGMIYGSVNYEWYFKNGQYLFTTDKDGPKIKFTKGTLSCLIVNNDNRTKKDTPYLDSAVIYNTSGIYDPLKEKWDGIGGKVTWEKVGLPSTETWADLTDYKISIKTTNYNCDTVTLHTPYFKVPILGSFSERTMHFTREIDKQFPQFLSFNKALLIKNVLPEVDYIGGFALKGSSFVGEGTLNDLAEVVFYRNQRVFARAKSQNFTIDKKGLYTDGASVSITLGLKDSITHPGANIRYTIAKDQLEFARGKTGVSQSPFSDSYHQLDMYVDRILWNRKDPTLILAWGEGLPQEQRIAKFESKSFFDEQLYEQLQGLSQVHPLVSISNYTYKYDEYVMDEGKLATALGRTIEQAKPLMLELANDGFLSYDLNNKRITVLPKVDNFVKAKSRKQDYDNIVFTSDIRPKKMDMNITPDQIATDKNLQRLQKKYDNENKSLSHLINFGEIDLSSLDMKLQGVDQVNLSTTQNTAAFPDSAKVIIQNNRNFYFNGWMNSGKWSIRIKDASYDYPTNKVTIPYSDYASMRVNPLQPADGETPIQLRSAIAGIKGELLVDDPSNRSGIKQKQFPTYPKLISKGETQIFYNYPQIQRGAYDSTRFYFSMKPFEFDSLDNFVEKNLSFKGELTSAGIFPTISQDLKIMPDYSLGFVMNAPATGYDFYGTGAKYTSKIVLSNNGLQGAGKIDYLTASADSKAFTFLPDSTTGVGIFINNPRETGIQMPDAHSDQAFMVYSPKNKVLSARSMKDPIDFFDKQAQMRGETYVRPTGMTGRGTFDFNTAEISSLDFSFKRWDLDADTANFKLIDKNKDSEDAGSIAFVTDNVNSHVSFEERKGVFKSNSGTSVVDFPINQYICKMDVFTWFMDKEEIKMYKNEGGDDINIDSDLNLVGANFISTNKDQDSLKFLSPRARFSLKDKIIYCDEAEFIDIADARIYPDSMKILIRKKAKMDPLVNSRIVANYITKYHQIVNATTTITARRAYTATGDYPYYDLDSNLALVKMDQVYLDSFQTVAFGNIDQTKSFKLSPQFEYYGKLTMRAANPKLYFEGATKINHSCDAFAKNWMSFKAEINPQNIQIPVSDNLTSLEGKPLSAGIVWHFSEDQDSVRMYPTFLSELQSPEDVKVITASGWLQYNTTSKEFQIATQQKLDNRASAGNYISLHTESCSMNGDGQVNVGMNYGDLKVDAIGVVNYNQVTKETTMNLTARISTPMEKSVIDKIADGILATPDLPATNLGFSTLEQAVSTWSTQKEADKFKSDYTLKGEVGKIGGTDDYTFVLSNLKLKSMPSGLEEKGFISTEPTADLVSIYGKPILKSIPMQVAFYKPALADVYRMGINFDLPGSSYYFNYDQKKKDGVMKIYTTDKELSQSISELKPEKKKIKNFEYDITTNSSLVSMFKRLFE